MKQIKKSLSLFMAAIFVMAGVFGSITVKAAETVIPKISYVGVDHSPLVKGDTEKFTVTSDYVGNVQYKAFIYNEKTKELSPLTDGYSAAVDAKTPYVLPETKPFEIGKYKLLLSVKRAGVTGINSDANGDYDTNYPVALNCVTRDDANRVYANGAAKVEINGLTVKFNGIEGIGGIPGPYTYRLHIFNPAAVTATNDGWTKRVSEYTATPSYTFEKAGTYMIVVHANTAKSVTWKNYQAEEKSTANQGSTYGTYEAWKTVMVVVKDDATVKVFDTTVKTPENGFGAIANVKLTTEGAINFATATKYQIFDGTKTISNPTNLGTDTTVYPVKVAGDKVTVKLLDTNSKVLKAVEVVLGQSGTIPATKVDVKAAIKKATGFGSLVTVTSAQEGVVKYQLFDGVNQLSATTEIGKTATVLTTKIVGDKVNVQLLDATGTVVATTVVALVAAE